jgi:hypothetical protein
LAFDVLQECPRHEQQCLQRLWQLHDALVPVCQYDFSRQPLRCQGQPSVRIPTLKVWDAPANPHMAMMYTTGLVEMSQDGQLSMVTCHIVLSANQPASSRRAFLAVLKRQQSAITDPVTVDDLLKVCSHEGRRAFQRSFQLQWCKGGTCSHQSGVAWNGFGGKPRSINTPACEAINQGDK